MPAGCQTTCAAHPKKVDGAVGDEGKQPERSAHFEVAPRKNGNALFLGKYMVALSTPGAARKAMGPRRAIGASFGVPAKFC